MKGDKAQEVLNYIDEHPADTQAEISRATGISRQTVHYTLHERQMVPPRKEAKIVPRCMYCRKEVESARYIKPAGSYAYHKKCRTEVNMYRGVCPVCDKPFKRFGCKVMRGNNGKPTSGVVTCSNRCRIEALHRGLFKSLGDH